MKEVMSRLTGGVTELAVTDSGKAAGHIRAETVMAKLLNPRG